MSQAPVHGQREYEQGYSSDGTQFDYHRVTEETKGTVNVPGGTRNVDVGDILVPGPSGDVFAVLDEEELSNMNQGKTKEEEPETETESDDDSDDESTVMPFRSE
jgi:hypothetical protein